MSRLRVLSICSGAGGLDMPFHWNESFEVVGLSEIDKYASAVLAYKYGGVKNYGDITKVRPDKLPDCDVFVAGTPCQDLSIAGKRRGLEGKRSSLFYTYVEILKEKKPSYFIWENVKGAISSQRGWDFARVQVDLAEAGYDIEFHVLNANEFGIPQNRERIFIVGYNRERGGLEVLRKERSGGEDVGKKSKNSKNIKRLGNIYPNKHNSASGRFYSTEGISPTVKTPTGGGAVPMIATRSYGELKEQKRFNCIDANYYKGMDNHGQRSLIAYSKSTRKEHVDHRMRVDNDANTLNTGDGCRTMSSANYVADELRVRKLTPLECERVMGWPDNHTQFGYFEEQGKVLKISDTQRYKMCGNGVVPQCVDALISVWKLD
jgi:DNA (cytosine-5)-methyltransferase 1